MVYVCGLVGFLFQTTDPAGIDVTFSLIMPHVSRSHHSLPTKQPTTLLLTAKPLHSPPSTVQSPFRFFGHARSINMPQCALLASGSCCFAHKQTTFCRGDAPTWRYIQLAGWLSITRILEAGGRAVQSEGILHGTLRACWRSLQASVTRKADDTANRAQSQENLSRH